MKIGFGKKILVLLVLAALLLSACGSENGKRRQLNVTSNSLFVQKVENLPDDFIMGMHSSCRRFPVPTTGWVSMKREHRAGPHTTAILYLQRHP